MEIKDAAIEKLKEIIKEQKRAGCLRIFATDGCCGPSINMALADAPQKGDQETEKNGLKIYTDKDAAALLAHAVIDCDKEGEIVICGLPKQEGHDCGCGH